jgi:hypothetical protein
VVVALVATEEKWLKFENSWREVLSDFDVPYLHLKELHHRHSGTGIYAKWKGDQRTPTAFLSALTKVIKKGINKTFCYGLVLRDYRDINKEFKLREGVGSPYVLTAASCFDQVDQWMKAKHPRNPIMHVFEQGDCGQKDFERLARSRKRVVVPIPKTSPETGEPWVQFQGADLVAGAYRSAGNKLGLVSSFEEYGEVFNQMAVTLPQKSLIHHKETLLAMCRLHPDKCPRRA